MHSRQEVAACRDGRVGIGLSSSERFNGARPDSFSLDIQYDAEGHPQEHYDLARLGISQRRAFHVREARSPSRLLLTPAVPAGHEAPVIALSRRRG
jgi:hypothetical protein